MMQSVRHNEQILIFDADDTLWENNVIFERVVDDFVEWLAHPSLQPTEIRRILAEIEEANIVTHGYGSKVFLRSLTDCFTHLMERPLTPDEENDMTRFRAAFTSGRVELIAEVADVLDELRERHELYLVTKGVPDEQQRKIDASALASHFEHVHIVAEKDVDTYRELARRHQLVGDTTWMIGNSPKSDIEPARAAGLRAVFIPNVNTWALEHAELDLDDEGILQLGSITELLDHF